MPSSGRVVPVCRVVHSTPSLEVWRVPRNPAPTNNPCAYVTIDRLVAVTVADEIHRLPLVDVNTLVPPTATNIPLPKATPDRGGTVLGLRSNQTAPSVEVIILPAFCAVVAFEYDPTATNRPGPCVTPDKFTAGNESGLVHFTPSEELA